MKKEIIIYSKGLCRRSVCAPKTLTLQRIEEMVNKKDPTGIDSKWTISDEKFADGSENPHSCELENCRNHYLFEC